MIHIQCVTHVGQRVEACRQKHSTSLFLLGQLISARVFVCARIDRTALLTPFSGDPLNQYDGLLKRAN